MKTDTLRIKIGLVAGAVLLVGSTFAPVQFDTQVFAKGIIKTGPSNSDNNSQSTETPQPRPTETPRPASTPPPPPPPRQEPTPTPPAQPEPAYEAPTPTAVVEPNQTPTYAPQPEVEPQPTPAPQQPPADTNENAERPLTSTIDKPMPTVPGNGDTSPSNYKIDEQTNHSTLTPSSPGLRPAGTPSVAGQITKRHEQADRNFNWRKTTSHYAYDPHDYRYWPPAGIVTFTNPYSDVTSFANRSRNPLTEAALDLQTGWMSGNIDLILPHIDEKHNIKMYVNGRSAHEVTPSQFYTLTMEGFEKTKTLSFNPIWTKRGEGYAMVKFRHKYTQKNGSVKTVNSVYNFRQIGHRGVIVRIDLDMKKSRR